MINAELNARRDDDVHVVARHDRDQSPRFPLLFTTLRPARLDFRRTYCGTIHHRS